MSLSYRYQVQFSILILILGIAWIGVSSVFLKPELDSRFSVPQKGFTAPDFTLQSSQGLAYKLSDYQGQIVLLNIWASWCAPCKAEMPAMQTVYEAYRDQGFLILAVNATTQDNINTAIQFADNLNLTFPILLDMEGNVISIYQIHAFPTSYFIDREGKIQEVFIGGPMAEAYLRTRIETLILE